MQPALDWLVSLPPAVQYALLAGFAAIENVIPPFPSDVTVAFVAFIAAKGEHRMTLVFVSAWLGNVAGALAMYELGRRHGASQLDRMLGGRKTREREARFRAMVQRFGITALFAARFVPGVRALVPVAAGALKLPALATATMIAAAAAIWYGLITLLAYRIDSDWPAIQRAIVEYTAVVGGIAGVGLVLGVAAWIVIRRGRPQR